VRVLLVEDDDRVADALLPALARRGFEMSRSATGVPVVGMLEDIDVVLLDLGLPDVDGMDLCRTIRAASTVAVIVVSARSEIDDRITALQAGADDYLVKPYDIGELVARVQAVSRRTDGTGPDAGADSVVVIGDVQVDLAGHRVIVAGTTIALSRKEFQILSIIVRAGGAVCSRERLLSEVWGRTWPGANRTLDVHIATLRTKLHRPSLLHTVRGVGYRLTSEYAG
jgi:DNA-binding response OmpR family regulator